jgi:hypothetical protein
MKKFGFSLAQLIVVVSIVSMLSVLCQAAEVTSPTTFRDRVMFRGSTGPDFDADNKFSIGGTQVTPTAAELNAVNSMAADSASGTSLYRLLYTPTGSESSATYSRYDLMHVGSEVNANSTNAALVGGYFSIGRPVAAAANWSGGTFDTGLRSVAINRATNDAAYGLRGAYVKAKNYTSGTIGGLEGLFIEAVGDGTEDNGEAIVLKLGTDNSTVDYGIDMDLITADVADIRLQNGALIYNSSASLLTITEATVDVVGDFTASTVKPDNGMSTNVTFITGTGTTGTFYFVSGILTNVVVP